MARHNHGKLSMKNLAVSEHTRLLLIGHFHQTCAAADNLRALKVSLIFTWTQATISLVRKSRQRTLCSSRIVSAMDILRKLTKASKIRSKEIISRGALISPKPISQEVQRKVILSTLLSWPGSTAKDSNQWMNAPLKRRKKLSLKISRSLWKSLRTMCSLMNQILSRQFKQELCRLCVSTQLGMTSGT